MKTATLKDVCQVSMGQAPDGASYNNSGEGFPLIAGAGDFGEQSPKPKKFTKEPTKLSQANDIILCIRATIGDLNWSDKIYCLGRGVAGLRPKADKLDRQYLWHWLASQKDYLFSQGTGSTFKQISRATIDDLSIPLPPLPEQKRIAAILDKADSIRRKRQEAIRLSEELLRSVFLDMFGDPVTNPKGWEVKPLCDLVNFTTGKLDSNAAVDGGIYPFFTCSREDLQIDTFAFDCEALLLAGNNASADYSVKYYKGKFNAYQRTYVISMASPSLSYRYMQYALEMKLLDMKRLSKGTNTKYLTLGILYELPFQVPDKAEQAKFERFIDKLNLTSSKLKLAEEVAEKSFNTLLQGAFKGEL